MEQANKLVLEFQKSAKSINKILGDKELVESIKATVEGLRKSTDAAQALLASTQGLVRQSRPG